MRIDVVLTREVAVRGEGCVVAARNSRMQGN